VRGVAAPVVRCAVGKQFQQVFVNHMAIAPHFVMWLIAVNFAT
jgi:hypothetical protein